MKCIGLDDSTMEGRKNLLDHLSCIKADRIFLLNDTPTTEEAAKVGRKTFLLLAINVASGKKYLIQSTAGTKTRPDKYHVWLADGIAEALQSDVVVIPKSRLGRNRRETTEKERARIFSLREAGANINKIAKEMHLGTRRIMEALKTY